MLFDERGRPDFRDVFGALASGATEISVAVTRVRLSTVGLGARELEGVEQLRVLGAEMNALHLGGGSSCAAGHESKLSVPTGSVLHFRHSAYVLARHGHRLAPEPKAI